MATPAVMTANGTFQAVRLRAADRNKLPFANAAGERF